jgi:5'-3' exonuclease
MVACRAEGYIPDGRSARVMTDILLLDAFSLVYRAFFALPAMSSRAR